MCAPPPSAGPGAADTGLGLAPELKTAIDEFVAKNKVVLFMKGTKQFPQCGFSNTCVQVRVQTLNHDYLLYPVPHCSLFEPWSWAGLHSLKPKAVPAMRIQQHLRAGVQVQTLTSYVRQGFML